MLKKGDIFMRLVTLSFTLLLHLTLCILYYFSEHNMSEGNITSPPVKPINLTSDDAIQLIGKYMPKEWKYLSREDVDILRIQ